MRLSLGSLAESIRSQVGDHQICEFPYISGFIVLFGGYPHQCSGVTQELFLAIVKGPYGIQDRI